MNKKTKSALILIVLAVFCLGVFVACDNTAPDFFQYSEDDLGVMGKLVRWMHSWIGNYGWTVVVFTVFLKLIMLPLDIWQRYAARKSSLKMQQMQPLMEGIDRRYGANTQRANEEKQKLYKKQGMGMMGTCLPMIVSMIIFFVVFAGLRDYSTYSSITNFQALADEYYQTYSAAILDDEDLADKYYNGYGMRGGYNKELALIKSDPGNESKTEGQLLSVSKYRLRCQIEGVLAARSYERDQTGSNPKCSAADQAALAVAKEYYATHHESWLWIKNVWQPDTWADVMQPYSGGTFEGGGFGESINMKNFPDGGETLYEKLRNAVLEGDGYNGKGGWNGLMILPFLSIGLSFLSMFISQRMERKNRSGEVVEQNQQQKVTNTTMMIIMPLMMAWFGFIYTGAFAIYMVTNYTLSILSTVALRYPVEKMVLKRISRDEVKNNTAKAKYMR